MEVAIVGVGEFGSALARVLEKKSIPVKRVHRHSEWPARASVVILSVPTQALPELCKQRKVSLNRSTIVISTCKGLIRKNKLTPTQYLESQISLPAILTLSGPSFASEIRKGLPTALVLAGRRKSAVDLASLFLTTPKLRIYKSHDPLGVELCGALKNVYAIAAGVSDGLNLGENARAALCSRALAEMSRVGQSLGGKPMTFFGLSGAGDLFLTCSSSKSRNYRFGHGLARKKTVSSLLRTLGTVEGYWTAEVAKTLCRKKHLRAPLIECVARLTQGRLKPQQAIHELMSREIRHEFD